MDTARRAVCMMIANEFPQMSRDTQIAMAIVTISQEIGFEVHLPQDLKDDPIVLNYYESCKRRGIRRTDETRWWCRNRADPLVSKWIELYRKYEKQVLEEGL
jgi:hypothetical protein